MIKSSKMHTPDQYMEVAKLWADRAKLLEVMYRFADPSEIRTLLDDWIVAMDTHSLIINHLACTDITPSELATLFEKWGR